MENLRRIFKKKEPPKLSSGSGTTVPPVSPGAQQQALSPTEDDRRMTKEDFEVLRLLGKGSFAKVVLVRHRLDGKIYAMKVVLKSSVLEHQRVQDVFTEKNILRRSTHPFLLKLHYTFQSETKLFFVMDFMQGGDLDTYLNKFPNKRLEYETARFYAGEILLALQYLHENQCIYRDLKPENILMTADGHVVLADFGLSKDFYKEGVNGDMNEEDMRTCSFVGSPFYVAPDVLKQKQYNYSIDYWSYGILVYRMLVGKVPFVGRNMKEVFDAIITAELRFSSTIVLPPEARDFISKLLIKDGSKRLVGKPVRDHPFFRGLDFDALYNKTYRVPVPQWVPLPPVEELIQNKGSIAPSGPVAPGPPSSSTPMPPTTAVGGAAEVVNTPIAAPHLPTSQQKLFDGFSYCEDPMNVRGLGGASITPTSSLKTMVDT